VIPETSAATGALVAALSSMLLAIFGVDYYSMLWALIGAMIAVTLVEKMSRGRAIIYVLLSMMAGAILGNVVGLQFAHAPKMLLNGLCLVGGLASQAVAAGLLAAAPRLTDAIAREIERRLGAKGQS
jgi:hypothetical protein